MTTTISPQAALIYVMVSVSASDARMVDSELRTIGEAVKRLPAFREFPEDRLIAVSQECAAILAEPDGLATVLGLAKEALNAMQRETALAFAWEVALADRRTAREEDRLIEVVRQALGIDRLVAAAIERAMRARAAPIGGML